MNTNTLFRIVHLKVPYQDFIEKSGQAGAGRVNAERIQKLCDIGRVGEFWHSEPMATTSAKFFIVEQSLRSLYGDPPHLFVDVTANYKLLRTRAPQSYDYGYVIEIGTMEGEHGPERLVAIPKKSVEYQSGRYSSGMYTPIDCS